MGPREYLKIKYSAPPGACKCGDCQLVPASVLVAWVTEMERLQLALETIAAIPNQEYGPDWEEIDKAREIATAALTCG